MGIFYINFVTLNLKIISEGMKNMDISTTTSASLERLLPPLHNNDLRGNTESQDRIIPNIRDSLLMIGNSLITASNYLLYRNGVLPLLPASFFMVEAGINTIISGTNFALRNLNRDNKNIDAFLTSLSVLTVPLLPLAVLALNWPTPNPQTMTVTYCFSAAASLSVLNHMITIGKKVKIANNINNTENENAINEQPTTCQKITNTVTSFLGPVAIGCAVAGVAALTKYVLTDDQFLSNNSNDEISFLDKPITSVVSTLLGLSITTTGLLVNTGMELYKNWCAKSSEQFPSETINTINNEEASLVYSENAEAANVENLNSQSSAAIFDNSSVNDANLADFNGYQQFPASPSFVPSAP